jgi:hypothetical protein
VSRITVDVSQMTLGEMADATAMSGDVDAPGGSFRQMAAMACVVTRRTDPEFTLEDALALRMGDIVIVEQPPEVPSGVTGVTPLPLPEPGPSALSK